MGADTCHHGGELRPFQFSPISKVINEHEPSPLPDSDRRLAIFPCPGSLFIESVHPHKSSSEPFYTVPDIPDGTGVAQSRSNALASRQKLINIDASPDVFVILAPRARSLCVGGRELLSGGA